MWLKIIYNNFIYELKSESDIKIFLLENSSLHRLFPGCSHLKKSNISKTTSTLTIYTSSMNNT